MRKGLILSTNEQKSQPAVEPKKLNIITSAIIPNAQPQPEPKPVDLSKMITTQDEDKVDVELGKPIESFAGVPYEDQPTTLEPAENIQVQASDIPEPKKKAGRPKKV